MGAALGLTLIAAGGAHKARVRRPGLAQPVDLGVCVA
jgi:hypothetical protein